MRYEEFLSRVQENANLDDRDEAATLMRVTMGTLGERIYRSRRDDLAAQLPNELKDMIGARTKPETTRGEVDRFTLEEFYNRVCARADIPYDQAVDGAKTVMEVLREAVTASEWRNLRSELPDEYDEILGT